MLRSLIPEMGVGLQSRNSAEKAPGAPEAKFESPSFQGFLLLIRDVTARNPAIARTGPNSGKSSSL